MFLFAKTSECAGKGLSISLPVRQCCFKTPTVSQNSDRSEQWAWARNRTCQLQLFQQLAGRSASGGMWAVAALDNWFSTACDSDSMFMHYVSADREKERQRERD